MSSNQIASCLTEPWLNPVRWVPGRITWTFSFISNLDAQIHSLFPDFGARVRAVNSNIPHRIGITETEKEWTLPRSSLRISVRHEGIACHLPVELYLSHRFVHICVSMPRLSNPSNLDVMLLPRETHKEPKLRLWWCMARITESCTLSLSLHCSYNIEY